MPYVGGIMDQPDGVIARFEIILAIRHEDEDAEMARAKSEPPRV